VAVLALDVAELRGIVRGRRTARLLVADDVTADALRRRLLLRHDQRLPGSGMAGGQPLPLYSGWWQRAHTSTPT
jgi:hypothetical protein